MAAPSRMRTVLLAFALVASCKGSSDAPRGTAVESHAIKSAPATPPLATKDYFRVDAAPDQPSCQVEAPCEARVILTALGDYHVNEKYPTKLVADATPGLEIDGTGSFSPDGRVGTMALLFHASKAGTAKIAGTFMLSVCNDENCQIESPKIAFEVAVR